LRISKILKVVNLQLRTFKFSTCGIAVADFKNFNLGIAVALLQKFSD